MEMSKKGSFAFASVIAALVLASWIERATPKAVNRDSASAEKTIRDFSLTGRQHFGVPSSNLRMSGLFDKYPFDEHMEKLREKAGSKGKCAEINEICARRITGTSSGSQGSQAWRIVAPCCKPHWFTLHKPRCRPLSTPGLPDRSKQTQVCVKHEDERYEEIPEGSFSRD